MARRQSRNRLQVRVEENVSSKLKAVQVSLRGPSIARALHEGAKLIQVEAQANAPKDTGQLQAGIYVASIIGNEYRPLVRSRNNRRLNSPLKFPPRPKQALVVSSVFYTRFIEGGVAGAAGPHRKPSASRKRYRGLGYRRKRPFFQQAKRKMRRAAEAHVQRRLVQLIEGTWSQA